MTQPRDGWDRARIRLRPRNPIASEHPVRRVTVAFLVAVALAVVATALTRWDSAEAGWELETKAKATSLVSDGESVCATAGAALHCLDAGSGRRRFTRPLGGDALALALVGRTLVVGVASEDGAARQLRAYSLDGERLWTVALREGSVISSPLPVASDGVVAVVEGPAREPVGIEVSTGEERWRISAPAVKPDQLRAVAGLWAFSDDDRFYLTRITEDGCHITAINPADGAELWRSTRLADPSLRRDGVSVGCPNVLAAVALEGERAMAFAVLGVVDPQLLVLDAADGSRRWDAPMEVETLMRSRHLAHVADVTVAITDRRMTGFGHDGERLWTRTIDDGPAYLAPAHLLDHSLIVRNGVLYHAAGGLSRVDPHTGERELLLEERKDDGPFRPLADVVFAADHMIVAGHGVEGVRPVP